VGGAQGFSMHALIVGAELFFALGFSALGVFMIWVAKPGPDLKPKFRFLLSETGQVLYSVLILCIFAVGFASGFHVLTGG
jgi:hypothetical protein